MKDPFIILSVINTKLRDTQASLEDCLEDLDITYETFVALMKSIGYEYSEEKRKIVPLV
ncbi:MAG: DUF4250 domain-containing protein [Lachnospiraceae bacterium]|nr:DUF4250 domain-containing protein [Lachnospiraceae bacterium]